MAPAANRLSTLVAAAIVLAACGGSAPTATPVATPPPAAACPDLTNADELAAFDYAHAYGLSVEHAADLRAALLTAREVTALSDRLDGDFGIACAQLAHDLGAAGALRTGDEACAAAAKAVEEARARLGPKAQLQLVVREPVCLLDPALVTKCASLCAASLPAGDVRADCEETAGRCDGACDGVCAPKHAMKCDGVCTGTCDGPVRGTCGGRCKGTCDGRPSTGACLGTCVGTCERGVVSGECKGTCGGSCRLAKAGICEGVCSGACSVELAEPRCAGGVKEPAVSGACRTRCALAEMNLTECTAAEASLSVAGAGNRDAAAAMSAAIERAFPGLLQLHGALGEHPAERIAEAVVVLDSAKKQIAASPNADVLRRCFGEALEKASGASTVAKTTLERAAALRDSVK